ncbi:hypothetical protein BJX62DRAFT_220300 [Aspergillus germanicus]
MRIPKPMKSAFPSETLFGFSPPVQLQSQNRLRELSTPPPLWNYCFCGAIVG